MKDLEYSKIVKKIGKHMHAPGNQEKLWELTKTIHIGAYLGIGKVNIFKKFKISFLRKYTLFQTYRKVDFHLVPLI